MNGISAYPDSTLLERVLAQLRLGPRTPLTLCQEVLGLMGAPAAICDRVAIALLGADPRVRQLADGRWESGFICEGYGVEGAVDISHLGGWRTYLQSIR